jgi:ribonuclease P protein component
MIKPVDSKTNFFVANIAKKSVKLSVDRNRYKRWIRAAYHNHKSSLTDYTVLIMPRRGMPALKSFAEIDSNLSGLFEGTKRGFK